MELKLELWDGLGWECQIIPFQSLPWEGPSSPVDCEFWGEILAQFLSQCSGLLVQRPFQLPVEFAWCS